MIVYFKRWEFFLHSGLMQALGAAEKVFELIKRTPKISTEDGHETPNILKGHISFQNVSFSYPVRPSQMVLQVSEKSLGKNLSL